MGSSTNSDSSFNVEMDEFTDDRGFALIVTVFVHSICGSERNSNTLFDEKKNKG
ncbi:hypothetical protein DAPPUDRAFT_256694 [Daphnia pulex]|uniref:Uncharacterized protein n=1 Tax=Daphnia pulex TaxID=6669 RepID=E9HBW9_DAPPU|nr:hypothetical protein DAPPUDRAFT_274139 [Daphnia pulex]EFX70799.1 hypothetical protein DAPPUDRAFT_256694 [Daphnia pulex]|eukprot:EFX61309.1 hypothetical protein DAPPUDRAFT_274139 [Daphnia pulex]